MSPEDHFKRFFEIVNRRDLEALGDGLAEEAEFYFPKTQPLRGRNQII
jgi:ketosteroid isomerase-like protein